MTMAEAILNKDVEELKRLQEENPTAIDELYNGITLSNLAASTGCFETFKYIVEYSRASYNAEDPNSNALFYAAPTNNVELVKYIVERLGLSGLKGDDDLRTPYDYAIEAGATDVVNYFKEVYGEMSDMYRNPIRQGMHPDPSIICVGDDFYMVNSSFVFFPCIPVSHSKDLIHWEVIGHAITNPEWAPLNELEGGRGFWAPDIEYNNGRFYITATLRLNDGQRIIRRQMVTSADNPEGPYTEPVYIDEDGIDPAFFTDDDGKRYILLNRGGRLFEINSDATAKIGEATMLFYGSQKRAPEGSHLLKKDGYYYLFQAEGGTGEGHRITVARSRSLFGVYEPCPYNPIMRQNDPTAPIQRCGHGKPVETPNGEWYIPYLCGRRLDGKYSILGRETALDKITWTPDGWPIINNLNGPSILAKKPMLKECTFEAEPDDFSHGLSKIWSWVRVPETDSYRIEDSKLLLKASTKSLDTMYARNILLRKQTAFTFNASLSMKCDIPYGAQAGLTCYYDENTYLTFALHNTENNGKLELILTEHIGHDTKLSYKTSVACKPDDSIVLYCNTDKLSRSFSYKIGEKVTDAITIPVNYLCDEGIKMGKRFTGAMIGMYSYIDTCVSATDSYYATFANFSVTTL